MPDLDKDLNKKLIELFENKKYLEGLRLALALHQKSKKNIDVKIHYQITNLIADIYRKNREHKKAIIYYKISLKQLSLNLKDNRDSTYNNQKDLAKKYRRIGTEYALLKINDSAIFYYNKLAELNSLDDEVLVLQASSFSNLAGIYQKDTTILNHYEKAIDYAERAIATHKKRNNRLLLELQQSSDILLETASEFNHLFCVGFSAESENIIKNAQAKLKNKHLDMIVANSINGSIGQNSAEIYIIDKNEVIHIPKKGKEELASYILQHIYKLENKRGSTHEHIN
jgi:hypothetical protein